MGSDSENSDAQINRRLAYFGGSEMSSSNSRDHKSFQRLQSNLSRITNELNETKTSNKLMSERSQRLANLTNHPSLYLGTVPQMSPIRHVSSSNESHQSIFSSSGLLPQLATSPRRNESQTPKLQSPKLQSPKSQSHKPQSPKGSVKKESPRSSSLHERMKSSESGQGIEGKNIGPVIPTTVQVVRPQYQPQMRMYQQNQFQSGAPPRYLTPSPLTGPRIDQINQINQINRMNQIDPRGQSQIAQYQGQIAHHRGQSDSGYDHEFVTMNNMVEPQSQVIHVPIFRVKKRILMKRQRQGCCGFLNLCQCCDAPDGSCGALNFCGCLDREVTTKFYPGGRKKTKVHQVYLPCMS